MINVDIYIKRIDDKKKQSKSALGLLYSILKSKYYLPAEDTCIMRGKQGKPYLLGCEDIQFSISHSGEYVCVAISDRSIGVDLQQVVKKREGLARRFFSEKEVYQIENGVDFFYIWTRKEAVLKADGCGITVKLDSFLVDEDEIRFRDRVYALKTLTEKVPEGYYLSVAVEESAAKSDVRLEIHNEVYT